jgi:Response regulator receiver domain
MVIECGSERLLCDRDRCRSEAGVDWGAAPGPVERVGGEAGDGGVVGEVAVEGEQVFVGVDPAGEAVGAEIPVVFLTARSRLMDRARGLELGAVDYILKPFNPVELAPRVRGLLERLERGERDELRREKISELHALRDAGVPWDQYLSA